MSSPYITPRTRRQIARILEHSELSFGKEARDRYDILILTGIADIAANPNRVESRARPELGRNTRSWHLRLSRERARTDTGIVKEPRHLLTRGGISLNEAAPNCIDSAITH